MRFEYGRARAERSHDLGAVQHNDIGLSPVCQRPSTHDGDYGVHRNGEAAPAMKELGYLLPSRLDFSMYG